MSLPTHDALIPSPPGALRRCAYCQEDIKVEAIVCRWCNRPVLLQAQRMASIGQWYTIGRAEDGVWSIWSLITGGAPVKRFAETEEGWQAAVKEYRRLEKPPSNVTWFIGGFVPLDIG